MGDQTLDRKTEQGAGSQDQERAGGSNDLSGRPAVKSGTCQYSKDGVCSIHRGKGIRKWKPVRLSRVGADGNRTTRVTKKYYFVCDVGPGGMGTVQPKLNFNTVTVAGSSTFRNITSTEGQNLSCVKTPGDVVDEN